MSSPDAAVDAWEALFRAQVSVMRDLRGAFADADLSMNEYDVLFNVAREPSHRIRLRDLNRNVLITQSSVSRLVDRLVDRGLIEKSDDEHDARGTIVALTTAGRAEFTRIAKIHMANIEERVGGLLTRDELRTLEALCTKLRTSSSDSQCEHLEIVRPENAGAATS